MQKSIKNSDVKLHRVRCVGRKRFPLAEDLIKLYSTTAPDYHHPPERETVTYIGHTRFATSSKNQVPELHPHEWTPEREEWVWSIDSRNSKFQRKLQRVCLHLTHNGDFDAMAAYGQTIVVDEIGTWLEKCLDVKNTLKGDSPKLAGCMDLLRVQGRWAAAARLAYIRILAKSPSETPCYPWSHWLDWQEFFNDVWMFHINNIIIVKNDVLGSSVHCGYFINHAGEKQFVKDLVDRINLPGSIHPDVSSWSPEEIKGFVYMTVRGFLRADLYNAMSELLTRAEGSFGVQVHCTLEPGVVVIARYAAPVFLIAIWP